MSKSKIDPAYVILSELEIFAHLQVSSDSITIVNRGEVTDGFPLSSTHLCAAPPVSIDNAVQEYFMDLTVGQFISIGKTAENFGNFGVTVTTSKGNKV